MPMPDIIRQLVERFEQHRDAYRSGRYNETQLRREFLDPFFEALGCYVFNELYGLTEEEIKIVEGVPYCVILREHALCDRRISDYGSRDASGNLRPQHDINRV
jgi:hypothetical protein